MADESKDLLLDEDQWKAEAAAVIQDVKDHLKEIVISTVLPGNNKEIYFNLTTLEGDAYCIQLSACGFRIVSEEYDTNSIGDGITFETPYSLLNIVSPKFIESFGRTLQVKLNALQGT